MKYVVGYDQELSVLCYRRNLRQMLRIGEESPATAISAAEVDYFSERLAETSVFSLSRRIGSPWMSQAASMDLVKRLGRKMSRAELVRCEHVANNMLILEGIVSRAGALKVKSYEQGQILRRKILFAEVLYRKAALGTFRGTDEKKVLVAMSVHVADWIKWLSVLPGYDYQDLLKGRTELGARLSLD